MQKKGVRKKLASALLLIMLCLPAGGLGAGQQGTSNYIYSYWHEVLPVPPAYTLQKSLTSNEISGVDSLANLIDCHVTNDFVYVLCSNQLIIFDHVFRVQFILNSYMDNGEAINFEGNTGIFATNDGDYYITQSEKARILHFNKNNSLRRVLGRPAITGFEDVSYRPTKLVVDGAGRIFVIAKGMYEGIVELQPDGIFSRFYGVNEVQYSFVDLIWRTIATEEQRSRMPLWLPTDFTSLNIDSDGFIFATIQGQENRKSVLRLNAKGENILKVPDDMVYPKGDEWTNNTGAGIPTGDSEFISIDTNEFGVFLALDSKRARVFAYNEDGNLLFAFGGLGDRNGYFRNPIDVDFVGNKIMVLDQLAQSIEIFEPTLYGTALLSAVYYQHHFDYVNASKYWQEALSFNSNLSLAYSGIGRALLREKKYDEALEYLQLGNDRKYYTKAFEKVRNEKLREWFIPGVAGIVGIIIFLVIINKLRRKRKYGSGEVTP